MQMRITLRTRSNVSTVSEHTHFLVLVQDVAFVNFMIGKQIDHILLMCRMRRPGPSHCDSDMVRSILFAAKVLVFGYQHMLPWSRAVFHRAWNNKLAP